MHQLLWKSTDTLTPIPPSPFSLLSYVVFVPGYRPALTTHTRPSSWPGWATLCWRRVTLPPHCKVGQATLPLPSLLLSPHPTHLQAEWGIFLLNISLHLPISLNTHINSSHILLYLVPFPCPLSFSSFHPLPPLTSQRFVLTRDRSLCTGVG